MSGYRKSFLLGFILFGLVVLLAVATFFISLGICPNGSLACDNGTVCVPQKKICDRVDDCQDGADENECIIVEYGTLEVLNKRFNKTLETQKSWEGKMRLKNENMTGNEMAIAYVNKCELEPGWEPKACKCGVKKMFYCMNLSLTEIPKKLPENIAGLFLAYNQIQLKNGNNFNSLNLTQLHLATNNISIVPLGLLVKQTMMHTLHLNHNQIRELPIGCFVNLNSLEWLFLQHNMLSDFDLNVFANLPELSWIDLSDNNLTLQSSEFPFIPELKELFLDRNIIESLNSKLFSNVQNLELLSVCGNRIQTLKSDAFQHVNSLIELRLSYNPIQSFEDGFFTIFNSLNQLYLDYSPFELTEDFLATLNVSYLSIKGFANEQINFGGIADMKSLKFIFYEKFSFCSATPNVRRCRPKSDGISSDTDLLTKPTLRYSAWFIAFVTCTGNALVLWGRFTSRDEHRSVSLVIRNLAFADILMGVYLTIIGIQDIRFRSEYHSNAMKWMESWQCAISGILAMISSEVSILILAFMSIERFLLISDPFGGHRRLTTKNVIMSLYVIWLLGVSIAVLPVIFFRSTTNFYGLYNGGTCFPLFIQEKFPVGWAYSAFIFLGLNMCLLVLIATLYTALLFSIYKTRRAASLEISDYEFAIRFFFIVLTDSCCWVPIITLKILVFSNVDVSGDIYAWIIIFVLPLNAAVNPLLYTFSTPKYRDQILANFSKTSFIKKESVTNSNQITADDSQGKIAPFLSPKNDISSNWRM